jgi:hypothetical protein
VKQKKPKKRGSLRPKTSLPGPQILGLLVLALDGIYFFWERRLTEDQRQNQI